MMKLVPSVPAPTQHMLVYAGFSLYAHKLKFISQRSAVEEATPPIIYNFKPQHDLQQ